VARTSSTKSSSSRPKAVSRGLPAVNPAKSNAKPASKAPAKATKPVAAVKKPSMDASKTAKPVSKVVAPALKAVPPVEAGKPVRKGITIVAPKPMKKPRPKAVIVPVPPGVGGLMSKGMVRKPLIPSGPKASNAMPLGMQHAVEAPPPPPKLKTPYNKKELERFRAILLRKRAELVGDVNNMESQALKDQSGSLSNLPQHIAEQGSEAYEQSLALDLAAADRKLIKEIDDALQRIEDGTYGVCELTGKPIKAERLEELPWARHSIEAAREIERRHMRS